jgi:hypothetical protein
MKNKFWDHVENCLLTEEGPIYFIGGTLCVDFVKDFVKGGIAMNLDGKGLVYGGLNKFRKNSQVYLPEYITDMVRKLYLRIKGETEHYREKVGTNAR